MKDLKILCLQTELVWDAPEKNRELLEIKIRNHAEGHDLVILPETFTTGFPKFPEFTPESAEGPTLDWMRKIASETNVVLTGSIILQDGDLFFNTLIWMRPDGSYETYAKRHVFSKAN